MKPRFVKSLLAVLLASACGEVQEPVYRAAADDEAIAYNGSIRISLAHPFDAANNDYELLFAAKAETAALGVCPILQEVAPCVPGGPTFYPAKLIYATETKRFFKTLDSALIENGLRLKIVALDAAGTEIDSRVIKFIGGGASSGTTVDNTSTGSTTGGSAATYNGQVKAILDRACTSCHRPGGSRANSPMDTYQSAKAIGSSIVARVLNDSMPPGGGMSEADKQILRNWQAGGFAEGGAGGTDTTGTTGATGNTGTTSNTGTTGGFGSFFLLPY